VRGHAAWALGRIGGAAAQAALAAAATRERDHGVAAEIAQARA
jgi:epoxyqueuosine reductase